MNIIPKSSKRGSSHGLVDYIAHSKLDKEKEGVQRRELFTDEEFEQELDVRTSNRHLSATGLKPSHDELLHLVLAPANDEFESIGLTEKERKQNFKTVVRATLAALKKEINAKTLKWVAALHLNTDNPHVHVAIQKKYVDERDGEQRELKQIPRRSMYFKETSENGEKVTREGALVTASKNKIAEFAAQVAHHRSLQQEKEAQQIIQKDDARFTRYKSDDPLAATPDYKDRRTLAKEMLLASEILRREANISNLENHGDKKRFEIEDAGTGTKRFVSLFDVERKIQIVAAKKAAAKYPNDKQRGEKLAGHFADAERAKNALLIKQLETIKAHVLGYERRHLAEALEKHAKLHNEALLIGKNRERAGKPDFVPVFKPDELQKLQSEAIRQPDLEKVLFFETVRHSLTTERRQIEHPANGGRSTTRRDEDLRELKAALVVHHLKDAASEKRLENWLKNKDFHRVPSGGKLWSNHALERHKREAEKQFGFWSKIQSTAGRIFVGQSGSNNSAIDYAVLREQINARLAAAEAEKREEIEQNKKLSRALDKIFDDETNPNKYTLSAKFTSYELAEVEDLALETNDFNRYKESLVDQEMWLRGHLKGETEKASQEIAARFLIGRAEARQIIGEMRLAERRESLAAFGKNKQWIKHKIADPKTGDERELSLKDVAVKKHYYLLDNILEKVFESSDNKNLRAAVEETADEKERALIAEVDAAVFLERELTSQKQDIFSRYKLETDFAPLFTPKEIAALRYRNHQTADKNESAKLAKIIETAEKEGNVVRLHNALDARVKALTDLTAGLTQNQMLQTATDEPILKSSVVVQNRHSAINQNQEILNRSVNAPENAESNRIAAQISSAQVVESNSANKQVAGTREVKARYSAESKQTNHEKNQSINRSASRTR
jgi:hypothetical protein